MFVQPLLSLHQEGFHFLCLPCKLYKVILISQIEVFNSYILISSNRCPHWGRTVRLAHLHDEGTQCRRVLCPRQTLHVPRREVTLSVRLSHFQAMPNRCRRSGVHGIAENNTNRLEILTIIFQVLSPWGATNRFQF